ncbi:MAG TPA: shikimate dehydrogenase, partial [Ramlibacter sp.]|nr:shikimate dehydrogenase [Ramlibacter sp.]
GAGFIDGLRAQGHAVKGWNVRLSGLGGAGAAIAVALAQAGVAGLTLNDQDGARQSMLVDQLQAEFPCVRIATGNSCDSPFDAVVNATPLGMRSSDPLPFDPIDEPRETLVVDVVTKPEMTPLLQRAADTGHRVHTGRHMHLGQARRVAEFFGFEMS